MILAMTINPEFIRPLLADAGIPPGIVNECKIDPVPEGSLAITFQVVTPTGEVCFLKFCETEGARGGPFLKHLLPIDHVSMREHSTKRRRFVRKALDHIVTHYRSTLVPRPLYFDLSSDSMAIQKSKEKNGVLAEYRVKRDGAKENTPAVLLEMVGTLWQGLEIDHLPLLSEDRKNVWEPMEYAPEIIFQCNAAIGEFQREAEVFVTKTIERKVSNQKGSSLEVRTKIEKKLEHEQRSFKGYETLMQDFLSALGIVSLDDLDLSLQSKGEELLKALAIRLQTSGEKSVGELQKRFLEGVIIPGNDPSKFSSLDFHKLVFTAEREKWWTPEVRSRAKALARLGQVEKIAQVMKTRPGDIITLIQSLRNFKTAYLKLETLTKGMVPQDGHPFNFFRNKKDGKITMLDLEDISMGPRFADLSAVYIFKIVRGFVDQKITEDQAIKLIQASIDGYNSEIASSLTQEELSLMADYVLAVFLNHLPQFGIILRLHEEELNSYNLAMSLEEFLTQFEKLQKIGHAWVETFLPRYLKHLGKSTS